MQNSDNLNNKRRLCAPASCFIDTKAQWKHTREIFSSMQPQFLPIRPWDKVTAVNRSSSIHIFYLRPGFFCFFFLFSYPTVESLFYFLLCPRRHLGVLGGRTDAAWCPQRSEVGGWMGGCGGGRDGGGDEQTHLRPGDRRGEKGGGRWEEGE